LILAVTVFVFAAAVAPAAAQKAPARMASARLVSDVQKIAPGEKFRLGVLFTVTAESHIYWRNPGDAGLGTMIEWKLPEGFIAGPLFWPVPVRLEEPGGLSVNAYTDSVMLFSWVQAPTLLPPGDVLLGMKADWLACRKICVQEADSAMLRLSAAEMSEAGPDYPLFEYFASLVPKPSDSGGPLRGSAHWTEIGGEPQSRIGELVLEPADNSLLLSLEDGAAVFFGDPSNDVTLEEFHLDTRRSSPERLVMHIQVRALRGRPWPDLWGGVLSARGVGPDGQTKMLALHYSLPGKTELNP
jgi:DsbC/DsbD-like thiol-disulfide interchange protein